jgi:hypothetical protein
VVGRVAGAMRGARGVLPLVAVALTACGRTGLFVIPQENAEDAGTSDAGTQDDGSADVVEEPLAPSDVRGQVVIHYTTDTGVEDRPVDLTKVAIEAYAELAQGGFARVTGSGASDGTFLVPQVPGGPFLLRLGSTVLVHPARQVSFESYTAGRPNATVNHPGFYFPLTLDGLSPWESLPSDLQQLVLLSSNAGCVAPLLLGTFLQVGATSMQNDLAVSQQAPTIDAMQGDHAVIAQFTQQEQPNASGDYYVNQLTGSLDVPSPELSAPSPQALQGTLQPVAFDQHVTVNLNLPAFEAQSADLVPNGTPRAFFVEIYAYANTPSPARTRLRDFGFGEVGFGDPVRPSEVGWPLVGLGVPWRTVGAFPLTFGNPFPGWSTWVKAEYGAQGTIAMPLPDGGTSDVPVSQGSVVHFARLSSLAQGSIAPMLTPPRDIRIDGADAFAGAGHVSASPTFTWTGATSLDPAFDGGTISYGLTVTPLSGDPTATSLTFLTTETRVTIPPELLTPGTLYNANVSARAIPGQDPSNPAYDLASVWTGLFSP